MYLDMQKEAPYFKSDDDSKLSQYQQNKPYNLDLGDSDEEDGLCQKNINHE